MSKSNVVEFAGRDGIDDPLRELLRTGAGELVYQAVQAELQELLAEHSQRRLSDGRAGVVRNGYLPAREIQTGLGPVTSNCQIWCSSAESSGDLIDICYLNSVFEFHSRDHLGQVREST